MAAQRRHASPRRAATGILRRLDDPTSFSGCNRAPENPSLSPGNAARLSQGLCSLAGFFAAHAQHPQQQMPGQPRARTPTTDAPACLSAIARVCGGAGHVPKMRTGVKLNRALVRDGVAYNRSAPSPRTRSRSTR